jgi:hypothetical protein
VNVTIEGGSAAPATNTKEMRMIFYGEFVPRTTASNRPCVLHSHAHHSAIAVGRCACSAPLTQPTNYAAMLAPPHTVSCISFVFAVLELIGYVNICQSVMGISVCVSISSAGFGGVLVVLITIMCLPTALMTCFAMFVHHQPSKVLVGSAQMTNELRARFSKPFQMKYLHGIQSALHLVALICALSALKGVLFPWAAIMSILTTIGYGINLGLVFKHFKNPSVPQSLNLEYGAGASPGAGLANGGSDKRVIELEKTVAALSVKVEGLEAALEKLAEK